MLLLSATRPRPRFCFHQLWNNNYGDWHWLCKRTFDGLPSSSPRQNILMSPIFMWKFFSFPRPRFEPVRHCQQFYYDTLNILIPAFSINGIYFEETNSHSIITFSRNSSNNVTIPINRIPRRYLIKLSNCCIGAFEFELFMCSNFYRPFLFSREKTLQSR